MKEGAYEVKLLFFSQFAVPIPFREARNDIVLSGEMLEDLLVNRVLLLPQGQELWRGSHVVLLGRKEGFTVHDPPFGFPDIWGRNSCPAEREAGGCGGWKDDRRGRHRSAFKKVGW